jgi:hypothetical protein
MGCGGVFVGKNLAAPFNNTLNPPKKQMILISVSIDLMAISIIAKFSVE